MEAHTPAVFEFVCNDDVILRFAVNPGAGVVGLRIVKGNQQSEVAILPVTQGFGPLDELYAMLTQGIHNIRRCRDSWPALPYPSQEHIDSLPLLAGKVKRTR